MQTYNNLRADYVVMARENVGISDFVPAIPLSGRGNAMMGGMKCGFSDVFSCGKDVFLY